MKSITTLALALTLAGCGAGTLPPPEPIIQTIEVEVPVDNPECARTAEAEVVASAPDFPDSDERLREAPNLFERVKLLLAGRELRMDYERRLEDAIRACAAP